MPLPSESRETFVPIRSAATRIGVPAAWLQAEAEAGRIPTLRVGRRFMVNTEAVQKALLSRAESEQVMTDAQSR